MNLQDFFNPRPVRVEQDTQTSYYSNGGIKEQHWCVAGVLHRENAPAEILYFTNSVAGQENWYRHGLKHRDDGPAVVRYDICGKKSSEQWFQHGKLHRLDGPAYTILEVLPNTNKSSWFINGNNITEQIVPWIKDNNIDLTNPNDLMRLKLTWA